MKFTNLIFSIVASLFAMLVGGIVVQYGWNNFFTVIPSVSPITLPVAIGIDLTVTYITGYASPLSIQKSYEQLEGISKTLVILITGIWTSLFTLGLMYLTTHFI